jgi:hypothetical protein
MEIDWNHAWELITRIIMMVMILGLMYRTEKLEKRLNEQTGTSGKDS